MYNEKIWAQKRKDWKILTVQVNLQYINQDSKLLVPVICFVELVYGLFLQSKSISTQNSQEGIKCTKAK